MPKIKPILFNTDMVRAILEGRKTVTRRVVKPQPNERLTNGENALKLLTAACTPYQPGTIMYVRETWAEMPYGYVYRADSESPEGWGCDDRWRPSIHMPREAARLFLRVTDVRVERLRDISLYDVWDEGTPQMPGNDDTDGAVGHEDFAYMWNSTIKPADRALYGWEANPWVWVIEFERISKEEAENGL